MSCQDFTLEVMERVGLSIAQLRNLLQTCSLLVTLLLWLFFNFIFRPRATRRPLYISISRGVILRSRYKKGLPFWQTVVKEKVETPCMLVFKGYDKCVSDTTV